MKITIEMTDRQLIALRDALRIGKARFERIEDKKDTSEAQNYAYRILTARVALDLDNVDSQACFDMPSTSDGFPIVK